MYESVSVMAILFPILAMAVILGFVLGLRYLGYRERMAMIEKGIAPPCCYEHRGEGDRRASLRRGITVAMVGLALTLGLVTLGVGPWLLGGLIPLFVGLSILIGYYLTPEDSGRETTSNPD